MTCWSTALLVLRRYVSLSLQLLQTNELRSREQQGHVETMRTADLGFTSAVANISEASSEYA